MGVVSDVKKKSCIVICPWHLSPSDQLHYINELMFYRIITHLHFVYFIVFKWCCFQ